MSEECSIIDVAMGLRAILFVNTEAVWKDGTSGAWYCGYRRNRGGKKR